MFQIDIFCFTVGYLSLILCGLDSLGSEDHDMIFKFDDFMAQGTTLKVNLPGCGCYTVFSRKIYYRNQSEVTSACYLNTSTNTCYLRTSLFVVRIPLWLLLNKLFPKELSGYC